MNYCFQIKDGRLVPGEDPIAEATDIEAALKDLGYRREISSELDESAAASITVYASEEPGVPRYYVDVMGGNSGIASLVAHDFPELLAVMKELAPLIALVGLDQRAYIRASDALKDGAIEIPGIQRPR